MPVQLSDLILSQDEFANGIILDSTRMNPFFASGVAVVDPLLDAQAKAGVSQKFSVPFFNRLGQIQANLSDDSANRAVPQGISTGTYDATKLMLNMHWGSMHINAVLGQLPDPMIAIRSMISEWWSDQLTDYIVAMQRGVVADNLANDGGDMVQDDSLVAGGMTGAKLLNAGNTLGDHWRNVTTIVMHSAKAHELRIANEVATANYADPSGANVTFETYQNKILVESDVAYVDTAGANPVYHTYLMGPGAILFGEGSPKSPISIYTDEQSGMGEGEEAIASRRHPSIHPAGMSYEGAVVAGQSPTQAEYANAANWDRRVPRKLIPSAVLLTQ